MLKSAARTDTKAARIASLLLVPALISAFLVAVVSYAIIESRFREHVVSHGQSGSAIVTESFEGLRYCTFSYQFAYRGEVFEGGTGGCPLVRTHPVGSTVEIRFLEDDPHKSFPVGGELWPSWLVVLVLLGIPILLMLGTALQYHVLGDRQRLRRSRHRA